MNAWVCCLSIGLAVVALPGCGNSSAVSAPQTSAAGPAPATPGNAHRGAPQRRSGWWLFTSQTQSGHSLGKQELCITPETEARFSAFDQVTQERLLGQKCSKADFRPEGAGWTFETACDTGIPADLGGGIVTSKGQFSGDLQQRYEIRMTVRQAGETHTGRVSAAWQGDCPAGRKAGDLVIDGDDTVNVLAD